MASGRVLVSRFADGRRGARTWWYDPRATGDASVEVLARRTAYVLSARAGRVGYLHEPDGGAVCTLVTPTHRPGLVLWRSCTEVAVSFAPGGARFASVPIYSDGPWPTVVRQRRTVDGSRIATYRADYVGFLVWEGRRTLLMEAARDHDAAAVRCQGTRCERASAVHHCAGRRSTRCTGRSRPAEARAGRRRPSRGGASPQSITVANVAVSVNPTCS